MPDRMHRWPSIILSAAALLIVVVSAGCAAKVQARTAGDRPPLDPPPPPPRVIAPSPLEATEPIDKSAGASPANVARPPSVPRPASPTPAVPGKPEAAKPETPVSEKTDPARADSAVRLLQTTPRGNEAEAEKSIRALLTAAGQTLGRVDYQSLKADARAQYNTAKRFMQQAEDALKAKNFAFAETLADKALELARSLK